MTKRAGSGSAMHALLDLELGEESSSDSDFRIEDHDNDDDGSDFTEDDDDDDDGKSNNADGADSSDDDDDDNDNKTVDKGGGTGAPDSDADDFAQFKSHLHADPSPSISAAATVVAAAPAALVNGGGSSAKRLAQQAKAREALERANAKLLATPICCACLGDRSDDANEIVECDSCGISVHEGCYGITDSASVSSTVSSCSTEPWFCEACKANVAEPVCELCPNRGGIFKETDVGKWVHLVCALYVPGVAFGEVDLLSSVTLFEMPYSKWGAKSCSLCDDVRFARTGVCIGCDAGMCRTFFHVTCAQAAGLLSEAHLEEADHADPFYAHCKVHSDKALIKKRKRNYNGLRLKMAHRKSATDATAADAERKAETTPGAAAAAAAPAVAATSDGQLRIERKLKKHRAKYVLLKTGKQKPWVPTQKMPRLLSTSASACRQLMHKADLMGVDTAAVEFQETQMAALADVRKKWHIPPAFSVEFIGYYLDRTTRLQEIKASLQRENDRNRALVDSQQHLRTGYDDLMRVQTTNAEQNAALKEKIARLHAAIQTLVPGKSLPDIEQIGRVEKVQQPLATVKERVGDGPNAKTARKTYTTPASESGVATTAANVQLPLQPPPARPMSVPTAAALKMGVGFPLTNLTGTHEDSNRILSTQCQNRQPASQTHQQPASSGSTGNSSTGHNNNSLTKLMHECGICAKRTDQHMLAKCDTCQLHYHLGCLNPPLQRHPKKSKLYGWQCSECADPDAPVNVPQITGPRKSRTKYAKDGTIVPVDPPQPSLDDSALTLSDASVQSTPNASASSKPVRAKGKPGRPRKIAAVASTSTTTGCGNISSADETGDSTTTAKRRKMNKPVTVTNDGNVAAAVESCKPTSVKSETPNPVVNSSLVLTTATLTATLENGTTLADGSTRAEQSPPLQCKQEFLNGTPAPDTAPLPQQPKPVAEMVKVKSAKKLKKEKDAAAILDVAATEPIKPAFYIDQNGVLTNLQQPTAPPTIVQNGVATNAHHPQLPDGPNHTGTGAASVLPKLEADSGVLEAAVADSTNIIHNSVAMTDADLLQLHKQNRKRRKELKHRQRHGGVADSGATDTALDGDATSERTPNKEHKKKRKKRSHDTENPNDGIPRIKIKFKALSLPGEPSTESHCFYVSADMVRPADDDLASNDSPLPSRSFRESTPPRREELQQRQQHDDDDNNDDASAAIPPTKSASSSLALSTFAPKSGSGKAAAKAAAAAATVPASATSQPASSSTSNAASSPRPVGRPPKPMPHRRLSVFNPKHFSVAVAQALKKNSGVAAAIAGPKSMKAKLVKLAAAAAAAVAGEPPAIVTSPAAGNEDAAANANATAAAASSAGIAIKCDVCLTAGTTLDVVRCDECRKSYHFRCLEPPLKKTPKRRGYSWHCADCDPTDVEST